MNPDVYRWTARVEDEHTLRVDHTIEVARGTELDLVAVPKTGRPFPNEPDGRLRARHEFLALPFSEGDLRFWQEIAER